MNNWASLNIRATKWGIANVLQKITDENRNLLESESYLNINSILVI